MTGLEIALSHEVERLSKALENKVRECESLAQQLEKLQTSLATSQQEFKDFQNNVLECERGLESLEARLLKHLSE